MDAKNMAIVANYAKAFVDLMAEKNLLEEARENLTALLSVFEATPLADFLSDISVSHEEKAKLVRLFQESSSMELNNFLEIILQNEREDLLEAIIHEALAEMDKKTNHYTVTVASAVALSDAQKEQLKAVVLKKMGLKTQTIKEVIDPSLIGGFVVQANNKVIDTSIKQQLQQLKMNLK